MHRALIVSLALAICLPSQAGIAGDSSPRYGSASYLTTTRKPVTKPRAANKRTNFGPARLNCKPETMTWGDLVRCGYDYPPWAMGWESFQRARIKSETR